MAQLGNGELLSPLDDRRCQWLMRAMTSIRRRDGIYRTTCALVVAVVLGCSNGTEGDLTSATTAIRAACRRFYGSTIVDLFPEPGYTGTSLLVAAELAEKCDKRPLEFRSDCHAERPAKFVVADGGCAVLGGYLAVYYERPPEGQTIPRTTGSVWATTSGGCSGV